MSRSCRLPCVALVAVWAVGCVPAESPRQQLVEISFRGERRLAQVQSYGMTVEGDIFVAPADIWDAVESAPGVNRAAAERRDQLRYKWPDGRVSYSVAGLPSGDQATARDALEMWRSRAPGLHLSELPTCSGDCIEFRSIEGGVSSSSLGRIGGTQILNVGTINNVGVIAHEFGHALGLFHEHVRHDRDRWVTINWANITGCRTEARSDADCGKEVCEVGRQSAGQNAVANGCCSLAEWKDGHCYYAHNFAVPGDGVDLLDYDYDSIMHYFATEFGKSDAQTITPVQTLPAGVIIGQQDHLSVGDVRAMGVMYPVPSVTPSIFRNTVTIPLVDLGGRSEDANTDFVCYLSTVEYSTSGIPFAQYQNSSIFTADSYYVSCTAYSSFWDDRYAYPNTSVRSASSKNEHFSVSGIMTVMSPGLIPVLFGP